MWMFFPTTTERIEDLVELFKALQVARSLADSGSYESQNPGRMCVVLELFHFRQHSYIIYLSTLDPAKRWIRC
jgi:hypothetical protein